MNCDQEKQNGFCQAPLTRLMVVGDVVESIFAKRSMIKLRLKRFGKKKQSSFRIVAVNSTSRRNGEPIEELGFYNPRTKESRINAEQVRNRLSTGAQPTNTVNNLLKKAGVI